MANNCEYAMQLVSKDKNVLKKMYDILNYKDNDYFIYRVFDVYINAQTVDEAIEKYDTLFTLEVFGDVAWDISQWFSTKEMIEEKIINGYDNNNEPIYGSAHYITLDLLCKKLGVGVEVWAQEPGCCFEGYATSNMRGETYVEHKDWTVRYEDENGKELNPPEEEGGFENFGEFSFPDEIYYG